MHVCFPIENKMKMVTTSKRLTINFHDIKVNWKEKRLASPVAMQIATSITSTNRRTSHHILSFLPLLCWSIGSIASN